MYRAKSDKTPVNIANLDIMRRKLYPYRQTTVNGTTLFCPFPVLMERFLRCQKQFADVVYAPVNSRKSDSIRSSCRHRFSGCH